MVSRQKMSLFKQVNIDNIQRQCMLNNMIGIYIVLDISLFNCTSFDDTFSFILT